MTDDRASEQHVVGGHSYDAATIRWAHETGEWRLLGSRRRGGWTYLGRSGSLSPLADCPELREDALVWAYNGQWPSS